MRLFTAGFHSNHLTSGKSTIFFANFHDTDFNFHFMENENSFSLSTVFYDVQIIEVMQLCW